MKSLSALSLLTVISLFSCAKNPDVPPPEPETFTVTWKNDDQILEIDNNVPKGTLPVYNGPTPEKLNPAPVVKDYVFKGWDKELSPVESDITYTATFKEEGIKALLAITFKSDGNDDTFSFENDNTQVDWEHDGKLSEDTSHTFTTTGEHMLLFYTDSIASFSISEGSSGITALYFADEVNKISNTGFKNCDKLKNVRLPSGLTNLNAYTFTGSIENVDFYNIIDNVAYLGNETNDHLYCFGTTNNEEIRIADGCEVLTANSFKGSSETTVLTLPTSLKTIGDNALSSCETIKDLIIPNNVTYIGESAFEKCYSLENVNIPNKLVTVSENAFKYCSALTQIVIPNSVKEIKNAAFYACNKLNLVDMTKVDHFITGNDEMFMGCDANLKIKVKNNELKALYENDSKWNSYTFIVD